MSLSKSSNVKFKQGTFNGDYLDVEFINVGRTTRSKAGWLGPAAPTAGETLRTTSAAAAWRLPSSSSPWVRSYRGLIQYHNTRNFTFSEQRIFILWASLRAKIMLFWSSFCVYERIMTGSDLPGSRSVCAGHDDKLCLLGIIIHFSTSLSLITVSKIPWILTSCEWRDHRKCKISKNDKK